MTEIIKINWLLLVAPFLWVLGVAVFIALLGHMEFLSARQGVRRRDFLKTSLARTSMLVGIGLICGGLLLYAAKIPSNKLIVVKLAGQNSLTLKSVSAAPLYLPPQELKMDPHNKSHILNNEKMSHKTMVLFWDGYIETPFLQLAKGDYTVEFQGRGSQAEGQFSRIKVECETPDKNDYLCTTAKNYFELTPQMRTYRLNFRTTTAVIGRIRISYFNDLYVPGTKEGRDVWVKELAIMPSATRGSFEKPPLDPTKLLFKVFFVFMQEAQLLMK